MIKVLFYVLCYLAIGMLLEFMALLISKICRVRLSDAIHKTMEIISHSDYMVTEEDVDEIYNIRKPYIWTNILGWPLNVLLIIHVIIQLLLEKVFGA